MKTKIYIPDKSYFNQAKKILFESDIDIKNRVYDFNGIRKACYNSEDFKNLLSTININKAIEISSGTSDRKTYQAYLNQIISDIKFNRYYRDYTPANGNLIALKAIGFLESLKLKNNYYLPRDICLTEGSTGAITMVFEFLKKTQPNSEVLIAAPNYYIYKLAAQYFNLKYKEILPVTKESFNSFISINSLLKNISNQTRLIIITNPSNPSGEIYSYDDIKRLLEIAKQKNILIMVDELFEELIFDNNIYCPSDKVASEINALNNLIVIKGYSKTKNLAAFRIGYLMSKNKFLLNSIYKIAEERCCFPVASNFTGLICLNSFIQAVNIITIKNNSTGIKKIIKKVKKEFKFSNTIQNKTIKDLSAIYFGYKKYLKALMKFYSGRFNDTMEILKDDLEISLSKQSAFNTIVKIKGLDKVNFFDYCLNLYLTTGVKTEIGPGFGFNQKVWQNTPNLGFWLRITFAKEKNNFILGLKTFKEFKKIYLNNNKRFLKTKLLF